MVLSDHEEDAYLAYSSAPNMKLHDPSESLQTSIRLHGATTQNYEQDGGINANFASKTERNGKRGAHGKP